MAEGADNSLMTTILQGVQDSLARLEGSTARLEAANERLEAASERHERRIDDLVLRLNALETSAIETKRLLQDGFERLLKKERADIDDMVISAVQGDETHYSRRVRRLEERVEALESASGAGPGTPT